MPDEPHKPKPRTCPHCGKVIPTLPKKPRDLGLLMHVLTYRVPVEAAITEDWIETARKHCRMRPERLAFLRAGPHARHWPRMIERRAARLAYYKQHGEFPPRWAGLLPGEPDHLAQLDGAHRYRKGGLAQIKARLRKHPATASAKLATRYRASKRIRSQPRKAAAIGDLLARLTAMIGAQAGTLTLAQYELLKSLMLADGPRRSMKKPAGIGSNAGETAKNACVEGEPGVPQQGPGSPKATP